MTCLDLDICEICIPLCYPVLTPYTDSIFRSTKKKKKSFTAGIREIMVQ